MPVCLKCCGFRYYDEVVRAIKYSFDAIGFILVPNRKRSIASQELSKIVNIIPETMQAVGVLSNPTIEAVKEWLTLIPLDVLQLHGTESSALCVELKRYFPDIKISKVFHVGENQPQQIADYAEVIDTVLLDSTIRGVRGGTGQPFDWQQIPAFLAESRRLSLPLWIAGGIGVQNVVSLLDQYAIDGIDVSSGIERNGEKDLSLIAEMVRKVKEYDSREDR